MDRTRIGQITPHMAQKRADTKQVFLLSLLHYAAVYTRSYSCGLIVTQTRQVKRRGGYERLKQWFVTLGLGFYCPSFRIFSVARTHFPKVRNGRSCNKIDTFLQLCSIFIFKVNRARLIIKCKRGYMFRLKRAIIRCVTGTLKRK